jgi:hypothetical protein
MSDRNHKLKIKTLEYVSFRPGAFIATILSLYFVLVLYFTGLEDVSSIPIISIIWTLIVCLYMYANSKVIVNNNYLYLTSDLTTTLILLDKCGFCLSSNLNGYYTLRPKFGGSLIDQICLKSETDRIVVFGDGQIIKMLSQDLPKLEVLHNG